MKYLLLTIFALLLFDLFLGGLLLALKPVDEADRPAEGKGGANGGQGAGKL